MDFILVRRFNYLDLFFNAIGVSFIAQGMLVVGGTILVIGALIAVSIEMRFTPASVQPDYIWQMFARENRIVDAIKIYRVMYKASLKEAHDTVVAYVNQFTKEV